MKNQLGQFYKNKKILITGNTGFKGSWLTVILKKYGANILGISLSEVGKPNMFNLLNLNKKIKYIKKDIRNFNEIKKIADKFQPEIVFHLAAQSLVMRSYADPLNTISTNVIGSLNILEYVRLSKTVKSLIYVTSDKSYENNNSIKGFKESDRIGGSDPYSSSKAAAENIFFGYLKSYFKNSRIGVATVRSGNVIGGGDWAENRIIPDIIKSIKDKKRLVIRNPNSTRPWLHVIEPLMGYLALGKILYKDKKFSGAWNFGPSSNERINVKKLVKLLLIKFSIKKKIIFKQNKNQLFKEANFLKLNCSKSNYYLKWKSRLNAQQSISLTADWYKYYLNNNKDIYDFTLSQINSYLENTK